MEAPINDYLPNNRHSWMSSGTDLNLNPNYQLQPNFNYESIMPDNDIIYEHVLYILGSSDLMSITKKQIREQLERHFNVDLTAKKSEINKMIESGLSARTN